MNVTPSKEYFRARIEQLLARMPAILAELPYAFGKAEWNGKFTMPPNWVLNAYRALGNKGGPFHYFKQLSKPGSEWTVEDFGLVTGVIENGLLLFSGRMPAIEQDKKENPELARYMERMGEHIQDAFPSEQKPPTDSDRLPTVENSVELAAFRKGQLSGSTKLSEADGTPHQFPFTYEILHHMCYFWPDVEDFNTAADLQLWLKLDADIHCSPKLVEKVCATVGKRFAKPGRPKKKIPISAKR